MRALHPNGAPRTLVLSFVVIQVLWVSALLCLGETAHAPAPVSPASSGSTLLALFRVLGALALVLGIFFGGLWVFRNWERFAARRGAAPKLTVREARSLGQRQTLYVIGYNEQRMLVAASPAGVSLLTSLPDAAEECEVNAREPVAVARPNFAGLILQALARKA